MVQNQITVSLCLTLLWSGYPSNSLASCLSTLSTLHTNASVSCIMQCISY